MRTIPIADVARPRHPAALAHRERADLLRSVQEILFFEVDETGSRWNPDKEWNADTVALIADEFLKHGLVPGED